MPAKIVRERMKGYRRLCNRFFHNDLWVEIGPDQGQFHRAWGARLRCEHMLTWSNV